MQAKFSLLCSCSYNQTFKNDIRLLCDESWMHVFDPMYFQSYLSHALFVYTYVYVWVAVFTDVSIGPEGACVIPGLFRAEEGLKTKESGDHPGAKEGGVP